MKLTEQQRTVVKKARDRIADPAHWCQGAHARRADGYDCAFDDPRAVKFCAVGALAVELSVVSTKLGALGDAGVLGDLLAGDNLVSINDVHGHIAVLALFDKALAE